MSRIFRAPLSDPSLPRPRREIIRLQGIRRMLEDLQRQIRELQAAADDRLSDFVTPEPMRSISSGPSLRPYQEHKRRQHQRHQFLHSFFSCFCFTKYNSGTVSHLHKHKNSFLNIKCKMCQLVCFKKIIVLVRYWSNPT